MSTRRSAPRGAETKDRILDAAEQLFIEQGFTTTSLRTITAKAKANLAAVNYHFGSKEALIREVFDRRLGPLNEARIAYLDRLEAEAGATPLTPEQVIEAIVEPALQLSRDPLRQGATFMRLLGRALSEPAEYMKEFLPRHYRDVIVRFKRSLMRSLPQLPEAELIWRMHFMFGTMAYAMAGNDALQLISTCEAEGADDPRAIVRRIVPFLAAGLRAPSPVVNGPADAIAAASNQNRKAA